MKKFLFALGIFFSFFTTNNISAQYWEVGGFLGASHYFGDLNTNFSLKRTGLSGGVLGRYNIDHRLCVKGAVSYANIGFSDNLSTNAFQKARNLSFHSNVLEGTVQFEFNFLPYIHGDKEKFFTPYLLLGGGVMRFNPKAEINGRTYNLRDFGTEGQKRNDGYMLTKPVVMFGGGFKIDVSYAWSLNFEVGVRNAFTDYLDDVSGKYADPEFIRQQHGDIGVALADRSGEVSPDAVLIGEQNRQRGDKISRDFYSIVSIGLVYNFASVQCPTW